MQEISPELKTGLRRIHENAKKVLAKTGFNIKTYEIAEMLLLESPADAGIDTNEKGHITIPADYTQHCVDIAPKRLEIDPGMNSFGLGGRVQFIEEKNDLRLIEGESKIRPATFKDLERAVRFIADNLDVIKFSHTPVGPPKSKNGRWDLYRMAKIMDDGLPGDFLKGISTAEMSDEEVKGFADRKDWVHIFCGVESPLNECTEKMQGLIRSARLGAVMGFSTMPMSGTNAPQSQEGLLTLCHAEVLFMLVMAQTVAPGATCIHYGYPCPTRRYIMQEGSIQHAMMNAAMARLNIEITGLPAMQSAAASSQTYLNREAIKESQESRAFLRHSGFHMMRHVFGILDNTNLFNFYKLRKDVERERERAGEEEGEIYIPEDSEVLDVIDRRGSSPTYMDDDHTLKHIECWGWR